MHWTGDITVVVLVLVLDIEPSWIIICDNDKVSHHLFGPTSLCIRSSL
jgi:hypothetical protein